MTQEGSAPPRKWKKTVFAMVLGGIVGFGATLGFLKLEEAGMFGALGSSEKVAALVGLLYVVTGLAIAVGLVRPKAGAAYLNVEDAEEIEEQRPMLGYSAATMLALGIALAVAALAGPAGIISSGPALALVVILVAAAIVLSLASVRYQDEFMRALGNEAGATGFCLLSLVGGGWALAAHLRYVAAPAPLDWMTMILALVLLAAFLVVGKRGMLAPR